MARPKFEKGDEVIVTKERGNTAGRRFEVDFRIEHRGHTNPVGWMYGLVGRRDYFPEWDLEHANALLRLAHEM